MRRDIEDYDMLEARLIDAALRYVAVADWLDGRPITRAEKASEHKAIDAFNQAEEELRKVGKRLLRMRSDRAIILEQALRANGLSIKPATDGLARRRNKP